ncbi:NAD(+) diphosphatase [Trueperella sp. LYQ143]|uniref:NAD(+) diphosphatase n=1 Tax=unclassified Trueperella TaxID=2630174 RepID=UPI003982F337
MENVDVTPSIVAGYHSKMRLFSPRVTKGNEDSGYCVEAGGEYRMYAQLLLARSTVQRHACGRADMAELLADPKLQLALLSGQTLAARAGKLAWFSRSELTELLGRQITAHELLYLGMDEAGRRFAAVDIAESECAVAGFRHHEVNASQIRYEKLTELGLTMDAADSGCATTALALAQWHRSSRYCPLCGQPSSAIMGGWEQRCANGHTLFPRTDPAVIMAIRDSHDRLLIGRNRSWPEGKFSTLAGFVEAGETLEAAVRREVFEEVGIEVGDVEYFGSQPWPFPRSLMLGFRGWTRDLHPQVYPDGEEILEARFVTREELRAMIVANPRHAPGKSSVARALIEDWLGEQIVSGLSEERQEGNSGEPIHT